MSNYWTMQPRHDALVSKREEITELRRRLLDEEFDLKKEIDQFKEDEEKQDALFNHYIVYQKVKNRRERLLNRIRYLNTLIGRLEDYYSSFATAYPNQASDVEKNLKILEQRRKTYEKLYSDVELKKPDQTGPNGDEISDPAQWVLDTSSVKVPKFRPVVSPSIFISRSTEADANHTVAVTNKLLSNEAYFSYADDTIQSSLGGGTLRNRYILYWKYKKEGESGFLGTDLAYTARNLVEPVGVGRTDDEGKLIQTFEYPSDALVALDEQRKGNAWHLKNELTTENFEALDVEWQKRNKPSEKTKFRSFITEKELWDKAWVPKAGKTETEMEQYRQELNNYSRLTSDQFDPNREFGFMVCPIDQGRFLTKDLLKLIEESVPKYGNATVDTVAVKTKIADDCRQNPIKLHCTLSEWNARLKEKLENLQYWVEISSLVKQPHEVKRSFVGEMQNILDLHTRYPYETQDDDNLEQKKYLDKELKKLYLGISHYIDFPTEDIQEREANKIDNKSKFNSLLAVQKEVDAAAWELWALLKSPALKAEVEYYLKHVSKSMDTEDVYALTDDKGNPISPPGPYMISEPDWETIFLTISQCYALLKTSSAVAEEMWEQDISVGFDELLENPVLNKYMEQMRQLVEDDNDGALKNYFISDDFYRDLFTNQPTDQIKPTTLFSTTLYHYCEIIDKWYTQEIRLKDAIGLMVPFPGTQCLLEVVLDIFGGQLFQKMLGKIKSKTYHLRLWCSVNFFNGLFHPEAKVKRVAITKSSAMVLVIGPKSNRFKFAALARENITTFCDNWVERQLKGQNTSPSEKFYGSFEKRKARVARSILSTLHLVLAIHNLQKQFKNKDDVTEDEVFDYWYRFAYELTNTVYAGMNFGMVLGRWFRMDAYKLSPSGEMVPKSIKGAKAMKWAGTGAKVLGIGLSFWSGALALEKSKEMLEKGDTDEAALREFEAYANFMLAGGYVLRNIALRFVAREAILAGFSWVPVAGQLLFVLGSIASAAILIYDIAKAVWDLFGYDYFTSDEYKHFNDCWNKFKAPGNDVKAVLKQDKYKHFQNNEIIQYLYDDNPFLTYKSEISQEDKEYVSREPILMVDDLRSSDWDEFWDEIEGVEWSQLNWRAIIPLYSSGMKIEKIKTLVTIEGESNVGINSVEAIIEYFEEVKKMEFPPNEIDEYRKGTIKELSGGTVAALLEDGEFTPRLGVKFHKSHLWQNPHFYLPYKHSRRGLEGKASGIEIQGGRFVGSGYDILNLFSDELYRPEV